MLTESAELSNMTRTNYRTKTEGDPRRMKLKVYGSYVGASGTGDRNEGTFEMLYFWSGQILKTYSISRLFQFSN